MGTDLYLIMALILQKVFLAQWFIFKVTQYPTHLACRSKTALLEPTMVQIETFSLISK